MYISCILILNRSVHLYFICICMNKHVKNKKLSNNASALPEI